MYYRHDIDVLHKEHSLLSTSLYYYNIRKEKREKKNDEEK